MKHVLILVGAATLLVSTTASADEEGPKPEYIVEGEDLQDGEKERPEGLSWRLNAGATFSAQDNRSVVGQQDGAAVSFGFKLDGGLEYVSGDHEWRNNLGVSAGVTRTPAVDRWVKAQDNLDVDSIYLYHINDWFGAFARVAYNTTMFRGTDIRPAPTAYVINRRDGTEEEANGVTTLGLTDPFKPSRFKESLGLFAQPLKWKRLSVETRLGGGARQTLAAGQLALDDDPDETPDAIEVKELGDVFQVGAEAALEVWGQIEESRVSYRASAEAMTPFYNNQDVPAGEEKSAFELTNLAFRAALSVKLVEWASLDYELSAIREPQLLDAFQVRNNLLLTFGLSAGGPEVEPEE